MRHHLLQVDDHGPDGFIVDVAAVLPLRIVALRLCETIGKALFEHAACRRKKRCRQLQHAGRIGDDLHRLDAGDIVEEPAAAGVHQHRVPLQLHEIQGAHALLCAQRADAVPGEEGIDGSA